MRDSKFHLNGLYFEKDLIHFELFSFEIKKNAAFRFIKTQIDRVKTFIIISKSPGSTFIRICL